MKVPKTTRFAGALALGLGLGLALGLTGCTGSGGSPGGTGGTGVVFPPGGPAPEEVPIRRLTTAEYTAAVNDLFPGFTVPPQTFALERKIFGFVNLSSAQIGTRTLIEQYEAAAYNVAFGDGQTPPVWTGVVADPTKLTGCNVATSSEMACAQPYLYGLARRAYRRALTDAEKTNLWALFLKPEGGDYPARLGLAIEGILISPNFLFRPELGDMQQPVAAGVVGLTPWEMASRLSFFINGSLPDDQLAAAADSGALKNVEEVRSQAQRLLAMPRSQLNLVKMHELWLTIDSISALSKNPVAFPTFTTTLAVEMGQETRMFLQNVMFNQNGTFNDLLLSPYTFGNADIAAFYGVPAPAGVTATNWGRIDLDPTQRMGLLTQPSLLATLTKDSPLQDLGTAIRRGKFVLQQLLCRTVSSPTPAILARFPGFDTNLTVRDQATAHEKDALCAGCHAAIDPLGLPFEHYDMIGRWRDNDRGMAIDVKGQVADADGKNPQPFDGIPGLAKLLTERTDTRGCYLTQWFQFSTGKIKAAADQPYVDYLTADLTPDKKLTDFVVDLVTSNSFRQHKIDPTAGSAP